jgi:hypothetical protein
VTPDITDSVDVKLLTAGIAVGVRGLERHVLKVRATVGRLPELRSALHVLPAFLGRALDEQVHLGRDARTVWGAVGVKVDAVAFRVRVWVRALLDQAKRASRAPSASSPTIESSA